MEQTINQEIMIPYIGCMTGTMVANYYGVPKATIKNRYASHKEEFNKYGVVTINSQEFEKLFPKDADYIKMPNRCMVNYQFKNGMTVPVSTSQNLIFPLKAVEYMSTVLQPSKRGGARHKKEKVEERNVTTFCKKDSFRDEDEKKLCLSLAKAYATGDTMKVLNAALALDTYRIKIIEKLKQENSRLAEEADKRMIWTERRSASRIVKTLSEILEQKQIDIWNSIYYKLTINYHLPLEDRKKLPLIDAVERSEWFLVYQAITELCEDKCLDIRRVFDKAEVNTSGLEHVVKGKL